MTSYQLHRINIFCMLLFNTIVNIEIIVPLTKITATINTIHLFMVYLYKKSPRNNAMLNLLGYLFLAFFRIYIYGKPDEEKSKRCFNMP